MTENNLDVFCPYPFMSASLESFDRSLPCCAYSPDVNPSPVHEFDQWWNHGLGKLRNDMLTGVKNSGCRRCWDEEAQGKTSQRKLALDSYPEHRNIKQALESPAFFMIGIGTHCNLKCIFCNPWRSSSIAQEYESKKDSFNKFGIVYQGYPQGADWDQESKALDTIKKHIVHARDIQFVGGEPLLKPVYLDLLDEIKNPENVRLSVNTSLERLSDRWIETLSRFQSSVHASIEAVGPLNDYIRHGSRWENVEANFEKLKQAGINVKISHVLSRTSFWTLPGIVKFMRRMRINEIHFHYLTHPESLRTAGATDEERKKFAELRFSGMLGKPHPDEIKQQIQSESYDADIDAKFWQYIDFLDNTRGLDFRKLLDDYQT